MKLKDVMLCLDCEEVFELETISFLDQKVQMDHCPSCGGRQIVRLCRWFPTMASAEIDKKNLVNQRR